eukprot:Skav236645  [mRNA]  locus=scaffold691:2777:3805:+ [translate_table: standard]
MLICWTLFPRTTRRASQRQKALLGSGCVKLVETFVGGQFSYAVMERCGPSLMDCFREVMCWDEDELARLFRGMLMPLDARRQFLRMD